MLSSLNLKNNNLKKKHTHTKTKHDTHTNTQTTYWKRARAMFFEIKKESLKKERERLHETNVKSYKTIITYKLVV